MPKLLTRASCRINQKRISAELSLVSPQWPNRWRDWTESDRSPDCAISIKPWASQSHWNCMLLCTSPSYRLPKSDRQIGPIEPELLFQTHSTAYFSLRHCWHCPTDGADIIICSFFVFFIYSSSENNMLAILRFLLCQPVVCLINGDYHPHLHFDQTLSECVALHQILDSLPSHMTESESVSGP